MTRAGAPEFQATAGRRRQTSCLKAVHRSIASSIANSGIAALEIVVRLDLISVKSGVDVAWLWFHTLQTL